MVTNSRLVYARYLLLVLLICTVVVAQEPINQAVSAADHPAPVSVPEDLFGTTKSYGDANRVSAPRWAQITSLGLAVWRLLLFVFSATKYVLRPILWILTLLHHLLRPVTLLLQLIYHLVVGVPFSVLQNVTRTLYPAYLFLGSAALIGLMIGFGLAGVSKLFLFLLPKYYNEPKFSPLSSAAQSPSSRIKKSGTGKSVTVGPTKRSPPATRTVMSSQSSLQTPTIMEESEFSSAEDENDFNTDSDDEPRMKPSQDYLSYKKTGTDHEGVRRRAR